MRSGPALQALMMGQVGREAETQARMTALCDNKLQHPQLRKVEGGKRGRGMHGDGGCMEGSWEETNFAAGNCKIFTDGW